MKNSEKNRLVLENFILHVTHTNEGDSDANQSFIISPNELYQMARDYIKEDHVDGEGNPEDDVVIEKEYFKELSLVSAYIIKEDLLGEYFFGAFDEAWKVAEEFVKEYPQDLDWEDKEIGWDETVEKFVDERYINGKRK